MTYIQNQKLKKPRKAHRKRRLVLILSPVVLVLIGIGIYYLILPGQLDSDYLKAIQPAYNQQDRQMQTVYKSLSNPVFTAHNVTPTSDAQNLTAVRAIIQNAMAATNTLATKNSFTALPGTEQFHAVSRTSKQYSSMQQYINDSKTFLANYETSVTYIVQFRQIENSSQLSAFATAMNTLDHATTASQLSAASQSASADLTSITKSLRELNAPIDFQQQNANLEATVSDANNAFLDTLNDITGENSEQVANSISAFNSAASGLQGFSTTNVNGELNVHSEVYQEMLRLRTEHPLQ